MTLPTAEEINPFDDLDGQRAQRHFLGKNLDEAEALFREDSLYHQEDLMWMGPIAFRFYIHAAIRFIRSASATGDSDLISSLAGLLEYRLEVEADELIPVAGDLAEICGFVIEDYDRFAIDPATHGDLRPRYETLRQAFSGQAEAQRNRIANRGERE